MWLCGSETGSERESGRGVGRLSLDHSEFGVPGTELMQHKHICVSDLLYEAVQYVYHLSFPILTEFCDGPYRIAQYSCHVLWQS